MTAIYKASTLQLLTLSEADPSLDVDCLKFAPNLCVLDLGDYRESPEKPLNELFSSLGKLRILKLKDPQQLSEESRAALPKDCAIVISPVA